MRGEGESGDWGDTCESGKDGRETEVPSAMIAQPEASHGVVLKDGIKPPSTCSQPLARRDCTRNTCPISKAGCGIKGSACALAVHSTKSLMVGRRLGANDATWISGSERRGSSLTFRITDCPLGTGNLISLASAASFLSSALRAAALR
jgi:hypothetical protein